MIGRKSSRKPEAVVDEDTPRGFDDFTLRLGDVMRGERATMGKSLLDVQRELRIKASYIAAIENCDPSAFDTPGFIAGYVRSYARYLGMDPDECFQQFCAESGLAGAKGRPGRASPTRKPQPGEPLRSSARDPFEEPRMPFVPAGDSLLSRIEPGAIGSMLVLIALIGGIGYGGWSVLREVQRVQLAPVDQTPVVLSELDPLEGAIVPETDDDGEEVARAEGVGAFSPPGSEALARLYRPQALDVPVLVARDAPISSLDPTTVGAFARRGMTAPQPMATPDGSERQFASLQAPRITSAPGAVTLMAVRPAWVRVRAADGSVIYEAIMNAGDTYKLPATEEPATLRVGESGAVYFAVNGQTYGPAGAKGAVTKNLALSVENLTQTYQVADATRDSDLERVVAELNDTTATLTD
ncbi:DUF4115 domain-containing protein [Salipiger sp. HF18]|uniref:helix-turn-helix domain-containing protein n=1 Tax=Salipiger sp. HF18 TaxID=2721557 RepID=UPI00142DDF96|nr:helix-turn-helix domain-containing protein [Salipiger sp. HF18]NIY97504.1 DUF4115 domain-containing protein [Salipiger sp. HF18]